MCCEGSDYKIVADKSSYYYHAHGNYHELNAEMIAMRSGFNDDRNDTDISTNLVPTSVGIKTNDIAKSVKNQTNNNVKLPAKPEKTGNFVQDHLAAVAYDADCAIIKTIEDTKEQLYQQTIGKLELMWTRLKTIANNIEHINCDPKVKEEIERLKDGDITALAGIPSAVMNVILGKISNDKSKKDNFDADAYYQAHTKNNERRIKLEKLM